MSSLRERRIRAISHRCDDQAPKKRASPMQRRRSRTRSVGGIQTTPGWPRGLANGTNDFLVGLPRPSVTSEPSVGMAAPPFNLRLNSVTLTLVQKVNDGCLYAGLAVLLWQRRRAADVWRKEAKTMLCPASFVLDAPAYARQHCSTTQTTGASPSQQPGTAAIGD
eukprot:CAMPEP_0172811872 /NCGR_PEP_ID=MMETSP1075-20121228/9685_1 /TAXON_ID=2916 /ORGANISM="Ceratium fusus, Strain PA161109" /LENGTH=164 /DNA_ID=CAMNT_0013651347 /DNA_START=218 /DNA_END=711 /DNA_ORIENTATION=-